LMAAGSDPLVYAAQTLKRHVLKPVNAHVVPSYFLVS
jgi:hypothetical protein